MFTKHKTDEVIEGITYRECDTCTENKELEGNYYLCSNGKARRHKCKACLTIEQRSRPARTPEQKRESRIRRVYGLRQEQFDQMWSDQEGKCKICKIELTVDQKNVETNVNIDHCHNSSLVRGLLCSRCNRGLGQFLDNVEFLQNAIDYLNDQHIKPIGLLTPAERGARVTGTKRPRRKG